jgi:hypothetical protein
VQEKIAEGKKKKENVKAKAKGQSNVAMTQNESIFKDIKLPGGISTKATEYQELARKGERWESPVFGLGSAAESNNIPKTAAVTRKPHSSTTPQVRSAGDLNGAKAVTNGAPAQIGGVVTA